MAKPVNQGPTADTPIKEWVKSEIEKVIPQFPGLRREDVLSQVYPLVETLARHNHEKKRKRLATHSVAHDAMLKLVHPESYPVDVHRFYGHLCSAIKRALIDRRRKQHGRNANRPQLVKLEGVDPTGGTRDANRRIRGTSVNPVINYPEAVEKLRQEDPDGLLFLQLKALRGLTRDTIAEMYGITPAKVRYMQERAGIRLETLSGRTRSTSRPRRYRLKG